MKIINKVPYLILPLSIVNVSNVMAVDDENNKLGETQFAMNMNQTNYLQQSNAGSLCSEVTLNNCLSVLNPKGNTFFTNIIKIYADLLFSKAKVKAYTVLQEALKYAGINTNEDIVRALLHSPNEDIDVRLQNLLSISQQIGQDISEIMASICLIPHNYVTEINHEYQMEATQNRKNLLDAIHKKIAEKYDINNKLTKALQLNYADELVERITQNLGYLSPDKMLNEFQKFEQEKSKKLLNLSVCINDMNTFDNFKDDINTEKVLFNNEEYELVSVALLSVKQNGTANPNGTHYITAKKEGNVWVIIDSLEGKLHDMKFNTFSELSKEIIEQCYTYTCQDRNNKIFKRVNIRFLPRLLFFKKKDNTNNNQKIEQINNNNINNIDQMHKIKKNINQLKNDNIKKIQKNNRFKPIMPKKNISLNKRSSSSNRAMNNIIGINNKTNNNNKMMKNNKIINNKNKNPLNKINNFNYNQNKNYNAINNINNFMDYNNNNNINDKKNFNTINNYDHYSSNFSKDNKINFQYSNKSESEKELEKVSKQIKECEKQYKTEFNNFLNSFNIQLRNEKTKETIQYLVETDDIWKNQQELDEYLKKQNCTFLKRYAVEIVKLKSIKVEEKRLIKEKEQHVNKKEIAEYQPANKKEIAKYQSDATNAFVKLYNSLQENGLDPDNTNSIKEIIKNDNNIQNIIWDNFDKKWDDLSNPTKEQWKKYLGKKNNNKKQIDFMLNNFDLIKEWYTNTKIAELESSSESSK